ncbi:arsenic efflux protein [bacterium]|nr:arsenic efflux protein [bacterium]
MIVNFLKSIVELNNSIFSFADVFIENLNLSDWISDAIIDSLHILPLIFLIFIIIEVIEYFFADKINLIMKRSEKNAPLFGSVAAIFPQCGFSVIASTLYVEKYITKGSLIAIYLATSDEAIPILLATPKSIGYLIPLVILKLIIAITVGYLVDFILKDKKYILKKEDVEDIDGCCHHEVIGRRKRDLLLHPLKHTVNIFSFILLITLVLNGLIELISFNIELENIVKSFQVIMPLFTAFFGLIPNCAISIALTMLLIKGSISFGAALAGLLSNGGLGIIILCKHTENKEDTILIVKILLVVSIVSGFLVQIVEQFI